jgi:hypothetical protein
MLGIPTGTTPYPSLLSRTTTPADPRTLPPLLIRLILVQVTPDKLAQLALQVPAPPTGDVFFI